MSLLTSGKLLPGELVERLLQLSPQELEAQPFGPLVLLVRSPDEDSPEFAGALLRSIAKDVPPPTSLHGWISTSEIPTVRVPSPEGVDPDQVELLAELSSAPHCIVPLRPPPDGQVLLLGRAPQCQIVLQDPSVSAEHATIHVEDGGLRITDQSSKNGTLLNGERLTPGSSAWLQPMDRLSWGRVPAFACEPRTLRAVLRHDLRTLL